MDSRPIHVLLIEQEQSHVNSIRQAFESHPGQVELTVVPTLGEGRASIATSTPDLVIADLHLSDGSGIDLLPPAGQEPLSPVLVLTDQADEQIAMEAIQRGALDYLLKSGTILADTPHVVRRALREWSHIAARQQAEEALRKERDLARQYLAVAGVIIVAVDPDEKVTLINPMGCTLLGYEECELVGANWFDTCLPQSNRDEVRGVFQKLMAGKVEAVQWYENPVLTRAGTERRILWHNTVLRDEQGHVTCAICSGKDVTQRKRAEEAYRSLVDHSLQGLAIFQEGRVVFANQAMAGISGYTIDEMLALSPEHVRAIVHPDDRSLVWERCHDRLEGKTPAERYEFRCIRKDGSLCSLEIHASRIEYQGRPAIQAASVDISQRKMAEQKLRQMEAQLAHVTRLLTMGEMVAGIAHEVSQPLYSILNFAKASGNVLSAPGPPNLDDLRQWNDEIATAAARAGKILDRLRGFVRGAEPQHLPTRMSEVAGEATQFLAAEAQERRIAVEIEPPPGPSLLVRADRVQIQQVLVNLVRNAFEAIEQGSRGRRQVTIRWGPGQAAINEGSSCGPASLAPHPPSPTPAQAAGQFVEVSVADSGPGLLPGDKLKIFEPFATTKPHGLGMGLAISNTIVEAHGGRLWATSTPDEGATFHFTLPVCDAGPHCCPSATGAATDVQ
jgi:two-component system sensor kinase FixL